MIKIKNQRGITLVALILTIIVTLILVSITVKTGIDSIEHSRMTSFVSRMQLIQKQVDFLAENKGYSELGTVLSQDQETLLGTIIDDSEELTERGNNSILKYFNKTTLASQLEIDNVDDEIVIDFTTREVISLNGIEYEGKMYYTQYNLPGGQKVEQYTDTARTLSFNKPTFNIDGLKATVTITGISITNGTLSYSTNYEPENPDTAKWTIITNYTVADLNEEEDKSVTTENITKSGTYYFKLVDNTDSDKEEYISDKIVLKLTNAPQLKGDLGELRLTYDYSDLTSESASTHWAYATDSITGHLYVWIPRFAYETNNTSNIEFLRGTSYVTTSEKYIPSSGWNIPELFKDVTGVWVKVSSADADNRGIIDNIIDNDLGDFTIL